MTLAAIVLAAGRSSRFENGNKLLARVGDDTLVRQVLKEVAASTVDDIVLVVSGDGNDVAANAGAGRWQIIHNLEADSGLASSIRCGMTAIPPGTTGALILLADMPGVGTDLIDRVIAAFRDDGERRITFPCRSDGRRGHPVLWPRAYFPQLCELQGDKGGKDIIDAALPDTLAMKTEDDGAFIDIDTRADLQRYTLNTLK